MIDRLKDWAAWREHLLRADTFGKIFWVIALHGAAIVLVVGGISFGLLQHMLKQRVVADIESEAKQDVAKFEQLISLTQEEVRNLSENTLFINAIIDTGGAKAYLDPFIKTYKPKGGVSVRLTLCDYRGVPISSNIDGEGVFQLSPQLREATEQGRAFAAIVPGPEMPPRDRLVFAYPVIWPGTGKAEGSLVAEIDVDILRTARGTRLPGADRRGLVIKSGGRELLAVDVRPGHEAVVVARSLRLPGPLGALGLSVELLDYARPHLWWFFLLYAMAVVALLALTTYVAGHLSALVTAGLKQSQEERDRVEAKMRQAQKLESLGVLAGGIAHDFNNLLMGILGNADLALRKCPADSPLRANLDRIATAVLRASDLTNQMLAYSGRGSFVVEPVNLSQLIEEMGQLLDTVISKRVKMRYNLSPVLPPLAGDGTQIRQVVMNLITNASDAIGDNDGQIVVSTGVRRVEKGQMISGEFEESLDEGQYVFVEVSDTGMGMSPETRARIFDPFFSTKQMGRGLGLAAIAGIVRGHRGGIQIQSELGKGSKFTVFLRATDGPSKVSTAPAEEPRNPVRSVDAQRPPRTVLLVDDEEEVLSVAKSMLEKGGMAVLTAGDGVEAVEMFQKHRNQLCAVLLDVTMPRMGGDQACLEMARIAPEVPVILSSGYDEEDSARRFPACRPAGFLQKPYRMEHLLAKVAKVLQARE